MRCRVGGGGREGLRVWEWEWGKEREKEREGGSGLGRGIREGGRGP